MTFIHQFNRRVRCTVTTTDEMPPKGKTCKLTFQCLQLGKVFIPVLMGLWYNVKLPQNRLRPKSAK